ncbi:alpha/beta hydrolase [Methylovirgula sp. 4M-Z18]|uniref:alpha/beta hydrolase n=1 Tax=Methylovirgula sp. 4M-Z18 TaxID=2293567 RepID=UPI000E2FBA0D|nr:alpha/beta hydrolase [Methylovirgula sp. 4M-Z18]RFB81335.1 alpha/beta hydrolase [Methylovirgula sp. 4M-Z18]
MTSPPAPNFREIATPFGTNRIAFRKRAGTSERPGLVWLGGFKSDMLATKASAIDAYAHDTKRAYLRFDYSGHGESGGKFEDGTIGGWAAEALAMIREETQGPQVLVGSSMGGWIALLVARALAEANEAERLAGLVLIAPAVDFTEALMWAQFPQDVRDEITQTGQWLRPTEYAPDPYPITRALIEDGRKQQLLGSLIRSHCPVHILQGMQDPDVPWRHAMLLIEHMPSDPVTITMVKDGDHRLSRDEDIRALLSAIDGIA